MWLGLEEGDVGDINLYAYVQGDPLTGVDPMGLWTMNLGLSFSIQAGPINISENVGLVIDGHGNLGVYQSPYAGVGAGAHGEVGLSLGGSNAETINDLNGPFAQASVGAGVVGDAGLTGYTGNSPDGTVYGGEVNIGLGFGAGGSGGGSYTAVVPIHFSQPSTTPSCR